MLSEYARWMQFVVACAILIGSFMHLDSKLGNSSWCDNKPDTNCIGDSLSWRTGKKPVSDYNSKWRETFTFAPNVFADTWTPLFFGLLAMAQCFPSMRYDPITQSWARCMCFYLFGAFWALFGYSGNWGVFWGFIDTLCLCFPLLILTVIGDDDEGTQVNLTHYFARLGFTHENADPKNNEVRPPFPPVNVPAYPPAQPPVQNNFADPASQPENTMG